MKIAFISYEYPPDTADGGIATYVRQAAQMLQRRGHLVEVFAGSRSRTETATESDFVVHRIQESQNEPFVERIGALFAVRHAEVGFDVVEGTDYNGNARSAIRLVPDMPLVLRLHTPRYLAVGLNAPNWNEFTHVEDAAPPQAVAETIRNPINNEREYLHAQEVDEFAAPCRAIGRIVGRDWGLDPAKIAHIPNAYRATDEFLRLPIETETRVVTFLGRLEMRKGILDLAEAIPQILAACPDVRFRLVGRPTSSPEPGVNMQAYLERELGDYLPSIDFHGPVPLDDVPQILGETDICVFPSRWENFPCVCLEAMAAGRGVVGSSSGGMAEMLEDGVSGLLVPPHEPEKITEAVLQLLADPASRMRMGYAARQRAQIEYGPERIATLQEEGYARAIARRKAVGPRFT